MIKNIFSKQGILLLLAAYLPFEPFLLKWVPDSLYVAARYLPEVCIYGMVAWIAADFFRKKISGARSPLLIPLVLLVATAVFSMALNSTPLLAGIFGIRQIVRFILVALVVYYMKIDELFIRRFLTILFSILFFQSLLGISQAIIGAPLDTLLIPSDRKVFGDIQLTAGVTQFWESGQRVTGTMGRYDQLGTFMALVMLLATALLYECKKASGMRALGLIALCAIPTFLLTYSRASWFGLLLGVGGIGYLFKKDKRILVGAGIFGVLACGYLVFSLATHSFLIDVPRQTLVHRFFEAFSLERWRGEYTALGRLYFFEKTPTVVVASAPLFGVGPGSYGAGAAVAFHNTSQYEKLGLPFGIHGTEGYIDNNWFSLWGEIGTIGLGIYLWMMAIVVRAALRVYRYANNPLYKGLSLGFLGISLAVFFQAFLATYFEMRTLAYYFWLLAGIMLAFRANCSGSQESSLRT